MTVPAISNLENNRRNSHLALATAAGAAVGAGARYVVPTKAELSQIINKDAVDTFVSSASTVARGSKRSILKYGGIGALVAAGLNTLVNLFKVENAKERFEYSKYSALTDTPADSAYAIMWYGEN